MANNIGWGEGNQNNTIGWGKAACNNTIGWGIRYLSNIAKSGCGGLIPSFALNFNTIASDFTFTRNSFATRVNEFGLIETVTDLGSELIQNGNFEELGSDLITSGNKTADVVSIASGQNITIQTGIVTIGKTYQIDFEIYDYVEGSIYLLRPTDLGVGTAISANGTYTYTVVADASTSLIFRTNGISTTLKLRGISVKQVDPNDDWTKLNATISDGKGDLDGTGVTSLLYQDILTDTKTYQATFTVSNYNGLGSAKAIDNNGSLLYQIISNGTFTFTFTHSIASGNGNFIFSATTGAIFSIDNVSVQEVLEDDVPRIDYTGSTFDIPVLGDELVRNGDFATDTNWVKQSGWSIANGVATFDVNDYVSGSTNIYQSMLTIGVEYVLTYDVLNYVQGTVKNVSASPSIERTANGTYTEKFIATNTNLFINCSFAQNTILSVDNISVKEVIAYTTTDKGSFLLEPTSTNVIDYSEDLSQWATFGSPVLTGGQDDLSGNTNAYAVEFLTSNDFIRRTGVNTTGTFTYSAYAKKSIGDEWYFNCDGNIGNYNFATESFTTGTGSPTGDMINVGNGWYRCTMTFTSTNAAAQARIQSDDGSTVILWGVQLEELSYATSYIPTDGSIVTRAAESCVDATPTINSEEGVLYAEISALVDDGTNRSISLNDGSGSNRVYLSYASGNNRLRIILNNSSGTQVDRAQTIPSITDLNKIAFKYKENDFALWINGVEVYTDTLGSTFPQGTLTELDFDNGGGSSIFYGNTKDLKVYDKALTDEELTELTTI